MELRDDHLPSLELRRGVHSRMIVSPNGQEAHTQSEELRLFWGGGMIFSDKNTRHFQHTAIHGIFGYSREILSQKSA